jgi:hypothetical protein
MLVSSIIPPFKGRVDGDHTRRGQMPTNFTNLVSKQFNSNNLQLFFHMPKTAGNSISELLGSIYGDAYKKATAREVLSLIEQGTIGNYKALLGHYRLCDPFYSRLKITINQYVVVREPIDRVISQYYFLRGREDHALHQKALQFSLEEILRSEDMVYEMGMSDFQTQVLSSFLRAGSKKLMFAYAKARLSDAFTFFSLYEELPSFIKICSHKLGWPEVNLPMVNVSDRLTKEELPKGVIKLIEDRNQLDLRLYQHATELYKEQMRNYTYLFEERETTEVPPLVVVVKEIEPIDAEVIVEEKMEKRKWFRFLRIRRWLKKIFGKGNSESDEETEI